VDGTVYTLDANYLYVSAFEDFYAMSVSDRAVLLAEQNHRVSKAIGDLSKFYKYMGW